MRQIIVGGVGVVAGFLIGYLRAYPVAVGSLEEIRSGYWKGRYITVTGSVERTNAGVYLIDKAGGTSLLLGGLIPAETEDATTEISGRLRRGPGTEVEDLPKTLQYVLEVGAAKVDAVAVASIVVVIWGAGLVWAGITVRKARCYEEESQKADGPA